MLVVVLAALCWSLGMPAATAEQGGRLRVAHLSPDTPAVDVAVARLPAGSSGPLSDPGPVVAADLGYGTVGDPVELPPGSYAVSVRAAGAAATAAPVLSARIDLPPGGARTVSVGGRFADLALHTLSDDLSAPPPGSARVRVLAAAAGVGAVDVAVRGGPSLATALPFGATGEARVVPAGPARLSVGGAGSTIESPVDFPAGSVVSLLVLDDGAGGLTVRSVLDAAGPAVVPRGGVEAGSGHGPGTGVLAPLAGVAAALTLVRRRSRVLLVTTALVALSAASPATAAPAPLGAPLAAGPAPGPTPPPVRLAVPSAGVDAALVGAGLDAGGALVPPADPGLAGWYTGGPRPGAPGPAVIAGHVDWAGAPGVFSAVARLEPGAEILVTRADGSTVRFTVTRVVRQAKSAFPTAEVYAPTSGAQLRLITCGGAFDRARGSYVDNVVVFARLVG